MTVDTLDRASPPSTHSVKPPRILALANQKGGVGKTTTAINLGTALAAIGENVLIVDLDPQGNASTGLGLDRRQRRISIYDVLSSGSELKRAVVETAVPQLFVAPSTLDLLGLELEIAAQRDRAHRLRRAIEGLTAASPDNAYGPTNVPSVHDHRPIQPSTTYTPPVYQTTYQQTTVPYPDAPAGARY